MKSHFFCLFLCMAALRAAGQGYAPALVREDTFTRYHTAWWVPQQSGYAFLVNTPLYGLTLVRFDSAFSFVSRHYAYRYISAADVYRSLSGDIMISGYRNSPGYQRVLSLLQLDSAGAGGWQAQGAFPGPINFGTGSVQVSPDTFLVTGRRNVSGQYDAVSLANFSGTGALRWEREYKTDGGGCYGLDVETAPGGEALILARHAPPDTSSPNIWLLRVSVAGDSLGSTYLGGRYDHANSLVKSPDGTYWVVTTENQSLSVRWFKHAIRVYKLSAAGQVLMTRRYAYLDDDASFQGLQAVRARGTADGGCIILGTISGSAADTGYLHLYLLKLDASGNRQWERLLGTADSDEATDVLPLPGGGYAVSATSWAFPQQGGPPVPYLYTALLASDGTTGTGGPLPALRISPRPSPFGSYLEAEAVLERPGLLHAALYDARGAEVRALSQHIAGAAILRFDTRSLPDGVYFLRASTGTAAWSGTVIKR
ncbi:MAG: hypothetical protein NW241_17545 [Bacteroidia bacterium]|nr:hypothetical protein [Bacteroidia bacterium]